ncbi:MAG: TonB-dependent receptor family protein [Saprospiraceae bacterium]|nr:TonB-dependent receptor family protein [Saprospiraceae bacterium]MDW8483984.1 outer membrane beta-barrel family protein [Saprospiraceae bacterium]
MNAKAQSLIVLLFPVLLHAQGEFFLEGAVLDRESRQGLSYATVAILDGENKTLIGTLTDDKGNFKLVAKRTDTLRVQVRYVGFQSLDTLLIIRENKEKFRVVFLLLPQSKSLQEITVRAERLATSIQIDRQIFDATRLGNTVGGTGLDVLQRLPAVTINTEGKILMRGQAEFLVTVNGKFTHLSPADVLAQLPANAIEAIEIISTPSASMDAEGKAGILNVITRKNTVPTRSIVANFSLSHVNRYGGDVTFYQNSAKINAFIAANYREYGIGGHRKGEIRTIHQDTVTYSPSFGERPTWELTYGLRAGAQYAANKSTAIHAALYYGYRQNDRVANLHYRQYARAAQPLDLYQTFTEDALERTFYNQNLFVRTGRFLVINSDFSKTFPNKGKLALAGVYEYSVLGGPLRNQDNDRPGGSLLLKERSDETSPLDAWRFQMDYNHPLSGYLALEIGYLWRAVHHRGDFIFERLNLLDHTWERDPEFNDALDLKQGVHAAYVQVNGHLGSLKWRAGLRGEHMDRVLVHRRGNGPVELRRIDFLPSVQLFWKMRDDREIKLGYSKRIDRPTTKALSPFKNHRHSEAIWVGDPNLLPEITRSIEATLISRRSSSVFTLTAYYYRTSNLIFRINDNYNRITLLTIFTNAGNSRSIGLTFTSDAPILKWLSLYISGNAYLFQIADIERGTTSKAQSINYNINANVQIKLNEKGRIQWNTTYNSRTVTAQGFDTELLLSNLSLRYTMHKNWTADLLFQNIFDTNRQTITNRGALFYSSTEYAKYDRIVQLTFSYCFNDSGKNTKGIKTEYGEKDF